MNKDMIIPMLTGTEWPASQDITLEAILFIHQQRNWASYHINKCKTL